MQLVQITFHFEFWGKIEAILDQEGINQFVRFPTVQGKDDEGKHMAARCTPAPCPWCRSRSRTKISTVSSRPSKNFREERKAHSHLNVVTLFVGQRL